jgi:hypothetical protein
MMEIDFEGGTTKRAYLRAFESQYQAEVIAKADIMGHRIDSQQNRNHLRDEELEVMLEQCRPLIYKTSRGRNFPIITLQQKLHAPRTGMPRSYPRSHIQRS